jgi:predicted NAD/FAD-dependent oxidoreductase
MNTFETHTLIVGAGITGLTVAGELANAGVPSIVLDKGSRPGGRMATRPLGGALADYGAQFLELPSERTRLLLKDWVQQGLTRPWTVAFPAEEERAANQPLIPKHMVVGGMNQLPAALARTLDVRTKHEVARIEATAAGWTVQTVSGDRFVASVLVMTAPLPQCVRLLEDSGIAVAPHEAARMQSVGYRPCFTLLARTEGASGLACRGGVFPTDGPFTWIADNHQKGVCADQTVVTAHATTVFSERHFADPADRVLGLLLEAIQMHIPARILETHLHRWRYAQVVNPLPERSLKLSGLPDLYLAGDAFGGKDIDGAILSGQDAAHRLLSARGEVVSAMGVGASAQP